MRNLINVYYRGQTTKPKSNRKTGYTFDPEAESSSSSESEGEPAAAKAATPKAQPKKPEAVVVEAPAEEKKPATGDGAAPVSVDDVAAAQPVPVTVNGDVVSAPSAESASPSAVVGTAAGGA